MKGAGRSRRKQLPCRVRLKMKAPTGIAAGAFWQYEERECYPELDELTM